MTQQLYNEGETFVLNNDMSAATYELGLYNDSSDNLSDSASYSAITTEPSGSAYATQTASATVSLNGSNNGQVDIDLVTFDVSDSSQTVDSVYIRDNSSGDLIAANALGSSYDLSNEGGKLEVDSAGFTLN